MHVMPTKREKLQRLAYCSRWESTAQLVHWHCSAGPLALLAPYPRDSSHSLIPLRVKKPAGFYFVFFPPEPGFMEPVGDNCSVLARLCHQCSVTKHTHTHTTFDITTVKFFSRSLISLLCLYLRFGPRFQIASQARFCEVGSVLSPASPC